MALSLLVVSFLLGYLMKGRTCSLCEGVAEPCYLSNNIEVPYLSTRNPVTSPTEETMQDKYCDLYALDPDTWYRSEYEMTTQVVQQEKCGTSQPIWLNGTIPEVADGIVSREACVRSFSDHCDTIYTVKIKQCQYYTVYCFPAVTSGCHQRYCFEVNITEIATSTTSTTTTPQTTTTSTSASIYNEELSDNPCHINVVKAVLISAISFIVFVTVLAVVKQLKRRLRPANKYRTNIDLYSNDEKSVHSSPYIVTKTCLSVDIMEDKFKQHP